MMSHVQRKPHRAHGNLGRWIRRLLWLNLNVSVLLLFVMLVRAFYHTLSNFPGQRVWWFAPGGPVGRLFGIPWLLMVEAVPWIWFFLPRRPGARFWAGMLGMCFLFFLFCIPLFAAMVWDMKVPIERYIVLYVGLSHLLFAFFGDDGGKYRLLWPGNDGVWPKNSDEGT
jgi:hypothetical protein